MAALVLALDGSFGVPGRSPHLLMAAGPRLPQLLRTTPFATARCRGVDIPIPIPIPIPIRLSRGSSSKTVGADDAGHLLDLCSAYLHFGGLRSLFGSNFKI